MKLQIPMHKLETNKADMMQVQNNEPWWWKTAERMSMAFQMYFRYVNDILR